jgi:hypothetical protein
MQACKHVASGHCSIIFAFYRKNQRMGVDECNESRRSPTIDSSRNSTYTASDVHGHEQGCAIS